MTKISYILFISNYWICEAFYADIINSWWELRVLIYSFIFYTLTRSTNKRWLKGLRILIIGDIVDRIFFSPEYGWNDLLILVFSLGSILFNDRVNWLETYFIGLFKRFKND